MAKYYCTTCNNELKYKFNLVCEVCHPRLAKTCRATEEFLDRQLAHHLAELNYRVRAMKRKQEKGNK